ncbi:hypothetical protein [Marinicellulosiphila megalodicopiae]|uniref:hypothetical protein n=1 Tax=Marinicellulosiphila megalodicopiae TaxID=2724896 RepID=UPI003BB11B55
MNNKIEELKHEIAKDCFDVRCPDPHTQLPIVLDFDEEFELFKTLNYQIKKQATHVKRKIALLVSLEVQESNQHHWG